MKGHIRYWNPLSSWADLIPLLKPGTLRGPCRKLLDGPCANYSSQFPKFRKGQMTYIKRATLPDALIFLRQVSTLFTSPFRRNLKGDFRSLQVPNHNVLLLPQSGYNTGIHYDDQGEPHRLLSYKSQPSSKKLGSPAYELSLLRSPRSIQLVPGGSS